MRTADKTVIKSANTNIKNRAIQFAFLFTLLVSICSLVLKEWPAYILLREQTGLSIEYVGRIGQVGKSKD